MAYKIIRSKFYQYQTGTEITAILDAASDLTALGTDYAPGSIAIGGGQWCGYIYA